MNERKTMAEKMERSFRGHVTTQAMGTETLIYDERRHMAFCLNASSSAVWRLADGSRTVDEIAVEVSRQLGAEMSGELVRLALDELRENGLLETSAERQAESASTRESSPAGTSSQTGTDRALSRRAMLARLGATALLPVIASIVAPTAAQAYSGCVDCSAIQSRRRPPKPVSKN
jgi:hypothetical protein